MGSVGGHWSTRLCIDLLSLEGLLEEPDDDGEVAAFIVGGEEDGVFVADCHVGRRYCIIFWL